ncbi:predicted Zn-dependent hydrolases of the beta-lactamase fold [hydrothermal vent metagenome]|uniref:Predicted Zn-dependent hydrolases of the beta-lactamase fold n=1 Tax=hydrothermal vent metagenome TaxID=652676 RepID=A0A1W1CTU1_9ZZZZ
MGIQDAIKAVEFIKPKIVVPMHYDTFDVIKADPTKFAQAVMLANLATCKVLSPGQSIVL